MSDRRITIRNIDPDLWDRLREVAIDNDLTLGEAVNDAIETWYDSLPYIDETKQTETQEFCPT